LIILQPEISAAILIVATASIMFFIAGAELKQILLIGVGAALTFWLVITNSSYASGRLDRYLESLSNPLQSSEYQVQRSVEALVRGGPAGLGVGNSLAHTADFFLPLSWSDNVFAIIGEELGLLGALLVILLFALLAYRGLRIALQAPDNFGMLTALGITSLLILQALLNIAVIVAASPPTGVTLPFISYGGSSLVTALGAIGILLSISYYSGRSVGQSSDLGKVDYARFDFGWRNRRTRLPRPGRRRPVAQAARGRSQ
jgi:cell division protein FtsW